MRTVHTANKAARRRQACDRTDARASQSRCSSGHIFPLFLEQLGVSRVRGIVHESPESYSLAAARRSSSQARIVFLVVLGAPPIASALRACLVVHGDALSIQGGVVVVRQLAGSLKITAIKSHNRIKIISRTLSIPHPLQCIKTSYPALIHKVNSTVARWEK